MSALAVLASVVLAGCGNGSTRDNPPGSNFVPEPYPNLVAGCLFDVCNSDESSRDYVAMYDWVGLRQINSDSYEEISVGIEGDLVMWQFDRRIDDIRNDDVFAYNITQDKLYAVGWESYYGENMFEVSQGRAVVKQSTSTMLLPEDRLPLPFRESLVLWTEATQERRILNTTLSGGPYPYGFDGTWVGFDNSDYQSDKADGGLYAMNVDTGEVVPLYLDRLHPSSDVRDLRSGPAVTDGFAYYEVHGREPRNQAFQLHEVNLATREDRIVHSGSGRVDGKIEADGRHIVWLTTNGGSTRVLYHYDRLTAQGSPLTDPSIEAPGKHGVGGDWIVYIANHAGGPKWGLLAVHIPTQTRHVLIEESRNSSPGFAATDGTRFVANVGRYDRHAYDTLGQDLYWGKLPVIAER